MQGVNYRVVYSYDGKIRWHYVENDACFSAMQDLGGSLNFLRCPHAIKYPKDKVLRFRYYPYIVSKHAERFTTEIKEAMPELPWGRGDLAYWAKHGLGVNTNLPGPVIVGLFSLVRYVHEEPTIIESYIGLRDKAGLPPLSALLFAHSLVLAEPGPGWICSSPIYNGGHTILGTHAVCEKGYKHFVHKKWGETMKILPSFNEARTYRGIHRLFSNTEYGGPSPSLGKYGTVYQAAQLNDLVSKWSRL